MFNPNQPYEAIINTGTDRAAAVAVALRLSTHFPGYGFYVEQGLYQEGDWNVVSNNVASILVDDLIELMAALALYGYNGPQHQPSIERYRGVAIKHGFTPLW